MREISRLKTVVELKRLYQETRGFCEVGSYDWRYWSDKIREQEQKVELILDRSARLAK